MDYDKKIVRYSLVHWGITLFFLLMEDWFVKKQLYRFWEQDNLSYLEANSWHLRLICGGALLSLSLFCYIALIYYNRFQKKRMREFTLEMEEATEGTSSFSSVLEEGEWGKLYEAYDKLLASLVVTRNQKEEEKEFLKETLSDISHQLKTPLASLQVFQELLQNQNISQERKSQVLLEMGNQLNRMEWLVLSMLKLARVEAGAITFQKKNTNLKNMLDETLEGVAFMIEEKELQVQVDCEDHICMNLDEGWMKEAVTNIIKNGVEFSNPCGGLRIGVEQTKVYTRISIKDEGCGISKEELPHIFERFHGGSNKTKSSVSVNPCSVGIGLSLAKSIVEGQEGSIGVTSKLGKGTEFILTFLNE